MWAAITAETPASTAVQQATSASDLHFYVTTVLIAVGVGVVGWLLRRVIHENDNAITTLGTDIKETNDKLEATNGRLSDVATAVARLAGTIEGAERANVKERQRVQQREPNTVAEVAQAKVYAEQAAATAAETNTKLDSIHVLVNSNLTASKQSELDATRRELLLLKAVPLPDEEALAATKLAEARIAELEAQLADRKGNQP
jgi:hypothetical protein